MDEIRWDVSKAEHEVIARIQWAAIVDAARAALNLAVVES